LIRSDQISHLPVTRHLKFTVGLENLGLNIGKHGKKQMSKRALILVDIQNDYFPGGAWELSGMNAAADHAAELLSLARQSGETVIFIKHEFPTSDAPFFKPGSQGAQIHDKVKNQSNEIVVVKQQINAFHSTNLKQLLEQNQIEEVVICGAMSHMCVDAIARAAHDYGFKVDVVHKCKRLIWRH